MSKFRRQLMAASMGEPVPPEPPTPIERMRQLGCIMWFPLDETNGLNDVIGGKTINIKVANTFTYSPTYSLYHVLLGDNTTVVADIDVSWSSQDFTSGYWSTVLQCRRYSNSSYRGTSTIFKTNHSGTAVSSNLVLHCSNQNLSNNTGNWTDDNLHTTTMVLSDNGRKIYHNGDLIKDDSAAYQHPWGCTKFNVIPYASAYNNKRVFVKNAMLFNRALTADEVTEVNTIINSL